MQGCEYCVKRGRPRFDRCWLSTLAALRLHTLQRARISSARATQRNTHRRTGALRRHGSRQVERGSAPRCTGTFLRGKCPDEERVPCTRSN